MRVGIIGHSRSAIVMAIASLGIKVEPLREIPIQAMHLSDKDYPVSGAFWREPEPWQKKQKRNKGW